MCVFSRESLYGAVLYTTGSYRNGDEWRHSWVERLSDSGYYCVNIRKIQTSHYEIGWFDECYVVENKDRYLLDW